MDSADSDQAPLLQPRDRSEAKHVGASLDIVFLRRFFRILEVAFTTSSWRDSLWPFYLSLIFLAIIAEVLIYFIGKTTSKFYAVFEEPRDIDAFWRLLIGSVVLFLMGAFVTGLLDYVGGRFALKCRSILTLHVQHVYLSPSYFYRWNRSGGSLETVAMDADTDDKERQALSPPATLKDSPDQRITDDVFKFSEGLRRILEKLTITPLLIAYYTYEAWTIGGWLSPCLIYAYFIVSAVLSKILLTPLVGVVYAKERAEGHFRYHHVRLRNNAESIAFLAGEPSEERRLSSLFGKVLNVQRRLLNYQFPVQVLSNFTAYFGAILSFVIIAIPIFGGAYDDLPQKKLMTLISTYAFYSMYLINKFTNITDLADEFSQLAGYTARIAQLLENMVVEPEKQEAADFDVSDALFSFTKQTIELPTGAALQIPSFQVPDSKSAFLVVIGGPSGSGKTSFIRHLAGLHSHQSCFSSTSEPLFLPQNPYLLNNATLYDQLCYPNEPSVFPQDQLDHVVRMFQLEKFQAIPTDSDLVSDPKSLDWTSIISPGEQQLVCLARAALHRPRLLIMDEGTSSLDATREELFMQWCREVKTSVIWITHQNRSSWNANLSLTFTASGVVTCQ